jgi:hypothetical protein
MLYAAYKYGKKKEKRYYQHAISSLASDLLCSFVLYVINYYVGLKINIFIYQLSGSIELAAHSSLGHVQADETHQIEVWKSSCVHYRQW